MFNNTNWKIRWNDYQENGLLEKALKDGSEMMRVAAYDAIGWKQEAMFDKHWWVRLNAYENLGFTKKALAHDEFHEVVELAVKYFDNCKKVLGLDETTYEFTKKEAELLVLNGIKVNELCISEKAGN